MAIIPQLKKIKLGNKLVCVGQEMQRERLRLLKPGVLEPNQLFEEWAHYQLVLILKGVSPRSLRWFLCPASCWLL